MGVEVTGSLIKTLRVCIRLCGKSGTADFQPKLVIKDQFCLHLGLQTISHKLVNFPSVLKNFPINFYNVFLYFKGKNFPPKGFPGIRSPNYPLFQGMLNTLPILWMKNDLCASCFPEYDKWPPIMLSTAKTEFNSMNWFGKYHGLKIGCLHFAGSNQIDFREIWTL